MNAPVVIEAGTDLVPSNTAAIVLFEQDRFEARLAELRAGAPAPADMSRAKNRDALRSYASDIRSEKASIDRDRLRLTKEWRDLTAKVNGAWKDVEARMDELAAEIRAPLTEWEEREKARIAECDKIITDIALAGVITIEDTSASVRQRGMDVWAIQIDAERFGDKFEQATQAKASAVANLKAALARLTQEEADKAELERLRAEAAERAEKDRIAAEQAEAARLEAERAEQTRIAAEQAEAQRLADIEREKEHQRIAAEQEAARIEQARKDAAEKAQRDAEAAAKAEQDRRDREHAEALAAEKRRADELAQAEADRIAKEKAAAAELARLEADKALQRRLKTEAKEAIMTCGASEDAAQKIVLAIRAGEVPHVEWRL